MRLTGVKIAHIRQCEIFVKVKTIVNRELDSLNSQIVTFKIPSEMLVHNQVLWESAKHFLIIINELSGLVDISTLVVCGQFLQGEVSLRGVLVGSSSHHIILISLVNVILAAKIPIYVTWYVWKKRTCEKSGSLMMSCRPRMNLIKMDILLHHSQNHCIAYEIRASKTFWGFEMRG